MAAPLRGLHFRPRCRRRRKRKRRGQAGKARWRAGPPGAAGRDFRRGGGAGPCGCACGAGTRWPRGCGWRTTRTAGSAGWRSTGAAPTARCPGTTARWCGGSARTASTCTASSSGSTRSRCSSTAPCAARSGSSRSDGPAPAPPLRPRAPCGRARPARVRCLAGIGARGRERRCRDPPRRAEPLGNGGGCGAAPGGRGGAAPPHGYKGGGGGPVLLSRRHAGGAGAGAALPLAPAPRRALVPAAGRAAPLLGGQSRGAALRVPPRPARPPLPHGRTRRARPRGAAPRRGVLCDGCGPGAAELPAAARSPRRSPVQGGRDSVLGARGMRSCLSRHRWLRSDNKSASAAPLCPSLRCWGREVLGTGGAGDGSPGSGEQFSVRLLNPWLPRAGLSRARDGPCCGMDNVPEAPAAGGC